MARRDPYGAWMRQAITLAERGRTSPNPRVGAVVLRGTKLISSAYHRRAGAAHAEAAALKKAGKRAKGATLVVTLEPCNHWGRTGPCTEAIIAAGVRKVVIGARDPAPHVVGSIAKLRRAGIEVVTGVETAACEKLIEDFSKHIREGLPYVTLKAALTLDGKMATRRGDSKWITSRASRKIAHELRAQNDAVLVGIGTLLEDDPALNVRLVKGPDPIRVVIDSDLRTPPDAKMIRQRSKAPTWIFHGTEVSSQRIRRFKGLEQVELIPVRRVRDGLSLSQIAKELGKREIMRLLVEGGATMHGAWLDAKLADRVALFIAPKIIGDAEALSFASGRGVARIQDAWKLIDVESSPIEDEIYLRGRILPKS